VLQVDLSNALYTRTGQLQQLRSAEMFLRWLPSVGSATCTVATVCSLPPKERSKAILWVRQCSPKLSSPFWMTFSAWCCLFYGVKNSRVPWASWQKFYRKKLV